MSGHTQTIWGHVLPSSPFPVKGELKEFELADGDRLRAHFFQGTSDVVTYVFHGLGGSAVRSYMKRTAAVCARAGHSVYLVNHRGCGEGKGLSRYPYHSGRGEDVSRVIELGRAAHPKARHLAIGFSLGGNALLCLLTGLRGSVLPDFAISVNAPIDLEAASRSISFGLNRVLYDCQFVLELRKHLVHSQASGLVDKKYQVPVTARLRDFDALYTAPAGGFESREHYYRTCSTAAHLGKISVPTVLLTADDDPIVPSSAYRGAQLSATTHLHVEKVGGHMGYLSRVRTPLGTYRWLDYALGEYVNALVGA